MIYKDICCVIGKYTGKDGKEKNRYQNVGVACFEDSGGLKWQKLFKWFNPAGIEGDCYLMVFDRKEKPPVTSDSYAQEQPYQLPENEPPF